MLNAGKGTVPVLTVAEGTEEKRKQPDRENHTALLFTGTSPLNTVLNQTTKKKKKSLEKFLQINQ